MEINDFKLYQSKLNDCDKEYFDSFSIGNEDALFQEMHDILVHEEDCEPEEFAESLIRYYHEHGDLGNSVNHRIAKWLIYQDSDYYEYGESELINADQLSGVLSEIEMEAGMVDWMKSGCYWCITAECFGYDFGDTGSGCMETFLADSILDTPYPDYTTEETRLILSEMCYDYVCEDEPDNMDVEEVLSILSKSDIRRAKIKSLDKALNKKAPEIYKRLCRNTAIAMCYCYYKLGDERKAIKELKNANISREEETLVAFSNNCCKGLEFETPLLKQAGKLGKEEQLSSAKGRNSRGKKRKRNRSILSKLYKFFKNL